MPRPRIDKILDEAVRGKLIYVIAGAGYGKTQAVHRYLEKLENAYVLWIQLTESDNNGSFFWENLTHNIAIYNPGIAAKLRALGFPENASRFDRFSKILRSREHFTQKVFLVLDDFHLIHSDSALAFMERCAQVRNSGECLVLISRTEPKINSVSMFSKGLATRITEEDLRFTNDEIADFLKLNDISFSAGDLPGFAKATANWALAVKLLSLVLKRIPNQPERALDIMKQNIFKLLETEAWGDLPEDIKKMIARLSLVSDLPFTSLYEVLDDAGQLQDMNRLTSFIWPDSFTGDFRIHPLYLEFLNGKQNILSDYEKLDTYRRAAKWCSENDLHMSAVNYYAKSRQFQSVIGTLLSYPLKLPKDTCEYILDILEGLEPDQNEQGDPNLLFLKHFFIPLLLIGTGRYEDARARSLDTIREWENAATPDSSGLLCAAYSNLSYIDMYVCTATHSYDAPKYLQKCVDCFRKSNMQPIEVTGPFTIPDIRSFACPVGEGATLAEFEQFLAAARETESIIEGHFHHMYYGYADLAACEIAFFKNEKDTAITAAHKCIVKAREKGQRSIEAMAEQYLLRIAVMDGDYALSKEILGRLFSHLSNTEFWNRYLIINLHISFFYAQIGLPDMAPAWFAMSKNEESEIHIPAKELIVYVKHCIAAKKYNQAYAALSESSPREPQERFQFGELVLSLLSAVVKIKTGDRAGAMEDFEKAWELSFEGIFEMFFIELGRNLDPLVAEALKHDGCKIPNEWLKVISRKASIYAKKSEVIRNAVLREHEMGDNVSLSDKEHEILTDLYHGLSREEISTNRHLSVNTVKKSLQSVYSKLNANNNVDAIRLALEKKLIE